MNKKYKLISNFIDESIPKNKKEECELIIDENEHLLHHGENSFGGSYIPWFETFKVLLRPKSVIIDIITSTKYTKWDIFHENLGLTYIKFNFVQFEWIIKNIKNYYTYYSLLSKTLLNDDIIDYIISFTWLYYDHEEFQERQYALTDY
jgi:hypothetical protein